MRPDRAHAVPMLLTVAGSMCSGKSTAGRACADLPHLAVHDFDEIGVPDGADLRWRQRSMEQWLRRVLEYQSAGVDVLLLGQSPLGEVLATPSAVHLDGLAAALVDVADGERLRRLEARDPGRWDDAARRACVGWAHWHRGHAADPRHRQEVITTDAWPGMVWNRWTAWTADDPRWTVTVLDTTDRSAAGSAADLRAWVVAARAHRTAC
ncbi:hypothetical protein Voc01_019300 [Virgisporangium ochraceum]|uniref:Uncharacterized protein n=2 Tax=Virgisporangium ochraceum TaxID=65505 RepID=A0A8J3ZS57_9ACTN|nr:hypothetical protein Voc01_019300 [Virgisporangium ochraceum]